MTQQPTTTRSTVADGVARLVWPPGEPVDNVRREVARALVSHARVEAHVDPDDIFHPQGFQGHLAVLDAKA